MHDAAFDGDAHAVAAWLDEGGGVDAGCAERDGGTMLMAAAYGGQEAMVRMLLQRGASVNLQDSFDSTALMIAADQGHTTTVQVLLEAKADASLRTTSGNTALMFAEEKKHTATAQLLRHHSERQAAEGEKAAMHAATTAPTAKLELNGRGDVGEPPPPLPGGYVVGDKVYYTGTGWTFQSGNRVEHGKQGEVVGPTTSESHRGKGVAVLFRGNKGAINCYLINVRACRHPQLPVALAEQLLLSSLRDTHRQIPYLWCTAIR